MPGSKKIVWRGLVFDKFISVTLSKQVSCYFSVFVGLCLKNKLLVFVNLKIITNLNKIAGLKKVLFSSVYCPKNRRFKPPLAPAAHRAWCMGRRLIYLSTMFTLIHSSLLASHFFADFFSVAVGLSLRKKIARLSHFQNFCGFEKCSRIWKKSTHFNRSLHIW